MTKRISKETVVLDQEETNELWDTLIGSIRSKVYDHYVVNRGMSLDEALDKIQQYVPVILFAEYLCKDGEILTLPKEITIDVDVNLD